MKRAEPTIRIVASAGIAVATFYGVFLAGSYNSFFRSSTLIVVLVAFGLWAVTAVLRASWRPRSRILPALLIPLAVLALTTATSRQPRLGLEYVAWSVMLVGLYLLLVRLMASPNYRSRMLALTAVLGLVVGVWYLQAVVTLWIEWWGLVGRISPPPLRPEFASLTFGNPSAVMLMSILLALPAIAWIGVETRARSALSIVLLGLAMTSTILSGSRAGWVGLAIGWTLATGLWLLVPAHRALVVSVIRSRSLRLGLGAIVALAVVVGLVLLPGVLFRGGSGGEALRVGYWQAALRMFAESPILGTGPGTWVAQRIRYTDVPANDYYIPHAHDIYIQTLAESGIVGVLAGLVVLVVVGGLVMRAIRSRDRARTRMGWAAVFALAYLGGHQLLDFYPSLAASLIAIAIPIAWLDAAEERALDQRQRNEALPRVTTGRQPWAANALALGGVAVVIVAAGVLRWSDSWAERHEAAVSAMNDGDYDAALNPARAAAAGDPAMTPYQVTLGLAASKTGNPAESAEAFARGAVADDFPVSWLGLAAARVELGDRPGAMVALDRGLRLGIVQPAIAIGAAGLYRRLGETTLADNAVLAAVAADPRLAGDANLPTDDPDAIVDRALASAGPSDGGLLIALAADRRAAAESIATQLPQPLYSRIVAAWYGDQTALAALEDEARARPLDLNLINWVGRTVGHLDPANLERYVAWGNIVNGNAGLASKQVRVTLDGDPGRGPGFSSQFYGHYTYNRPTPWNLSPGGVLTLISR